MKLSKKWIVREYDPSVALQIASELNLSRRLILRKSKAIAKTARKYSKKRDFLYIGRNLNYPIALEGALKLKEISYIHAEGYAAGEMKHGPIALIDKGMPIVAIVTAGGVYEKLLSNVQEARARNLAKIIVGRIEARPLFVIITNSVIIGQIYRRLKNAATGVLLWNILHLYH